jgi:ABC-type multidrug transport system ATPase subunit
MRQRLSYVVASLSDPSIYLLDEPTTSLDHTSQVILLAMLARLKAQGKTILIATHAASEFLPLSDRVIELRAPEDNLAFTPTMPDQEHYARP